MEFGEFGEFGSCYEFFVVFRVSGFRGKVQEAPFGLVAVEVGPLGV